MLRPFRRAVLIESVGAAAFIASGLIGAAAGAPALASEPRLRTLTPVFDIPCLPGPDPRSIVRGVNCRNAMIDGFRRQYLVYVPTSPAFDPGRPSPVVFMFHGSSGDGEKFLEISGWREKAEQEGFVAVFPTALQYWVLENSRWSTKWNHFTLTDEIDVSKRLPGYPEDSPWPTDDVAFTRAMIADLEANLDIDPKRIFVSGFSNGGQFAARLAVEASDVIAAVASAAGNLDAEHTPVERVSVCVTIGTLDDRFYEAWGVPPPIPLEISSLFAIEGARSLTGEYLATFDLLDTPTETREEANFTEVRWTTPDAAAGNPGGNELIFALLGDVTHQYPTGDNNPEGFVMTEILWPFFLAHPKP
jgi:polyhydroxybutyrate depolymerase